MRPMPRPPIAPARIPSRIRTGTFSNMESWKIFAITPPGTGQRGEVRLQRQNPTSRPGHYFSNSSAEYLLAALRRFDQLHLPFPRAVQDHHFALRIAKYKYIAVAEVRFFDRLFEGHRPEGD